MDPVLALAIRSHAQDTKDPEAIDAFYDEHGLPWRITIAAWYRKLGSLMRKAGQHDAPGFARLQTRG